MPEETPGQQLSRLIKERFPGKRANHTGKSQFARTIGKSYQTIDNWCNDKGFGLEQQEEAATALGYPKHKFSTPQDVEELAERHRLRVLAQFREHDYGRTLSPDEWRSLESFRWPERVAPQLVDYWGLALVVQGKLTTTELEASLPKQRQAASEVAAEPTSNADDPGRKARKKPQKKRRAHSSPRK